MAKEVLAEREDGKIVSAKYTQSIETSEPTPPLLVIFINGFPTNNCNFFAFLTDALKDINIASIQFSFTHCESTKENTKKFTIQSATQDLQTLYLWAKKEGYEHIGIIAEGLGAPIVLSTMSSAPQITPFCILCWPALDLKLTYTKQFKGRSPNNIKQLEEKEYFEYENTLIGKKLSEELQTLDIIEGLKTIKAPTLILHGEKDTIISPEHIDVARKNLISSRLNITIFDDGDHGLTQSNHRRASLIHITSFIQRYAPKQKQA